MTALRPNRITAQFWRGGTSNGVMLYGPHLPKAIWTELRSAASGSTPGGGVINLKKAESNSALRQFFCAVMGSPDPYGRQLNGMGGGLSSLSKAVIVDRSMEHGIDLDYLFVQIGIKDGKLDLQGNCGNMTSAVAPYALDAGILQKGSPSQREDMEATTEPEKTNVHRSISTKVRLRNLNTQKLIDVDMQAFRSDQGLHFQETGPYIMDGVPGHSSPITVSFRSPAGSKTGTSMPTGNVVDEIEIAPGEIIRASLLDVSNPGVFIDGRKVGWDPSYTPEQLNENTGLMAKLERIRQEGARRMGLDPETQTIPKIVLLFPPTSDDVDIVCQALSMGQAHKATPVTLALNLGIACKVEGTIAHELARARDPKNTVIQHPSGKLEVGGNISSSGEIISANLIRTARCLMEGFVNTTHEEA